MKHSTFIGLIISFSSLIFSSCSNELDVLDEYKEIPIVYGLINPNITVNYVRLQKGFLGVGNALVMAQQPDSIYYDTSIVDLQLIALKSGKDLKSYPLTPVFGIIKDEGLFTDVKHIIYQLVMKNLNGDTIKPTAGTQYKLKFTNKATGLVDSAITDIIEPLVVQNFGNSTTFAKINLASKDPYIVRLFPSNFAKVYGMIFRFKYLEENKVTRVLTNKSIDYYLPNVINKNTSSILDIEFPLLGQTIFQFLGSNIKVDPSVTRSIIGCDFELTAGTQQLYDYIQINAPSNTVDYIPEFTNLSEGKGIFTCRINNSIKNILFNDLTLDSIYNGVNTKKIFGN